MIDKRILNILVIIVLSILTFSWTSFVFHYGFNLNVLVIIISSRIIASFLFFKDFSLSWSKSTQKTFLIKSLVTAVPFLFYASIFYGDVHISFLFNEAITYLASISFLMYSYWLYVNRSNLPKRKKLVIYGAGRAGNKIEDEFRTSEYRIKYFVDDFKSLQGRSIDGIKIISSDGIKKIAEKEGQYDLLVIAMPSAPRIRIQEIHEELSAYFKQVKVLPTLEEILNFDNFSTQLKDISIEDLLARHPKDLDKGAIESFLKGKIVLITGAGGSIGSEISRQCATFGVKKLVLLDHSEFNLYQIGEELVSYQPHLVMQSVVNLELLEQTFVKYRPDIVIHAAAYKHVPLVEANINEAIINNIIGTKNTIDCAIKYDVKKFVLISTDKAVRPANVMGATKRICELYAQNINTEENTEIVAVRFGNVLGSSGSVIPKFKSQIATGGPVTVTDPEITRYFMLIPEACELVLQAASLGRGGEIFILDMGEPIKIADLAQKMIDLSGRSDVNIEFTGLRPGEKLYEELLINDSDMKTKYDSITVAGKTEYDIQKLTEDIKDLLLSNNKCAKLKEILPDFDHKTNCV